MELIGRNGESEGFRHLLSDPQGDTRIFNIFGRAGQGKTVLGQKCLRDAESFLTDLGKLDESAIALTYIDLSKTGTSSLLDLIQDIHRRLIDAGLNEESDFKRYKSASDDLKKERGKADIEVQGSILAGLRDTAVPNAFLEDLRESCNRRYCILLAFDTFEQVALHKDGVGGWILSDLQMPGLICIISGRKRVQPIKQNLVYPVDLDQATFSDDDVLDLLKDSRVKADRQATDSSDMRAFAKALALRMQHRPLLIRLSKMAGLNSHADLILNDDQLNQRLISWLHPSVGNGKEYLGDDNFPNKHHVMRQVIAYMPYLNYRFDEDMLHCLVDAGYVDLMEVPFNVVWDTFREQEFLKELIPVMDNQGKAPDDDRGVTYQLHDWLAEQGINHLFPAMFNGPKLIGIKKFCRDVVTWYDGFIDAANDDKRLERALRAEQAFYRMNGPLLRDLGRNQDTARLLGE